MITIQMDQDVIRWGLHELCTSPVSVTGSSSAVTEYNVDLSSEGYVHEGYCEKARDGVENDEIIARAYQEELSKLADAEKAGSSDTVARQLQESIVSQRWNGPLLRAKSEKSQEEEDRSVTCSPSASPEVNWDVPPEMTEESMLDGEVGKRLNRMVPVPHVPKINGLIPSEDAAESDHQRLLGRLIVYALVELKVKGDGNCQFRSLSDQIYRSPEHHFVVRKQVVEQLRSRPDWYEGYVPMQYAEYLKKMSRNGEWGDHVTLQAAADAYGVKIFVLTSFKDTCYIEILPRVQMSKRVICLSFWAEVHYNSIYPEGAKEWALQSSFLRQSYCIP